MPFLLALDTSTERLVVAVQGPQGWQGTDEPGGPKASARIIPTALALLADAGLRVGELDAIGFGRGPGAFTGLRTACAVAQGFAFGGNKPVLPLDSLLVVAEDARAQVDARASELELWVAMDARMDEVYAAAYRWQAGRWSAVAAPALYGLGQLAARWQAHPPSWVAGSAPAVFGHRLGTAGAAVVDTVRDRPAALLRVATACWDEGGAADAAQALPVYLRDKVALTTAERDAARSARHPGGET
jgi:tRNA threonylcarbamoyladenosine biosynthesis protein TsaB